ncbi:MAG: excinuclease ABC subunit UvrA [Clostridia bacterium]
MIDEKIVVVGAKENNLKNVSVEIPRNKLVVFSGVSGSGKSTLAFDTIFAEGQRRYMESLSSYARMFLGQSTKPDVERIDGLSPAISIDQKSSNHNPRSTVGTVTEIFDYLRLLFARIGKPYCPNCKKLISQQTIDQIVEQILSLGQDEKIMILAPIEKETKGTHAKTLDHIKRSGFSRVEIDGSIYTFDENIDLDKNKKHTINIVVDRIVINEEIRSRLTESVETALKQSEGKVVILHGEERLVYSTKYACTDCGYSIEEISPRLFSFNAPFGACPNCGGLGFTEEIDEGILLKNSYLSISKGAFNLSGWNYETGGIARSTFKALAKKYNFSLTEPVNTLSRDSLNIILYGTNNEKVDISYSGTFDYTRSIPFEGLIPNLQRRYHESTSEFVKYEISRLMKSKSCPVCNGARLKKEVLSILIDGKSIADVCFMSINECLDFFQKLKLDKTDSQIAESILKEVCARLKFLLDVGLNYLTLSRSAESLSGGESQRIRLATQIGSGLVGVLYILDEPSIGLHQKDNDRLLNTLVKLRNLGNTLIVVEHDEDTIRSADYIVDVGPMAGVHGGEIVVAGSLQDVMNCKKSMTGQYLSGVRKIVVPEKRRNAMRGFIRVEGASQNNLQAVDANFPIGLFTVVTGVSGSGKSSLVNEVLYPALSNKINRSEMEEGTYKKIVNFEEIDKVISIDQKPIGRTPRSNPATYTGIFTLVRELFASTVDAKERGFAAGRFSFNVSGGRCEACEGDGVKKIEMYFLPDVYVPCEVCKATRYNRETLEVKYKGKNISDILEMTVEEALEFFKNIPKIFNKIKTLHDVGLDYIKLGQSATTLSGGEAQRVKLATELAKRSTGKTIFVLDEPTTGLHAYDVHKLIDILNRLVDAGNTVVVIEHNLDVIKCADYIIDLGPEGGSGGGRIIATGTPEEISENPVSETGKFLKKFLKQ